MPPPLASLLYSSFIIWLLWRDIKRNREVSHALWIPLCWMLIIGSRLPSEWLGGGAIVMSSPTAYEEGSPVDRNVFLILILIGIAILIWRSVAWRPLLTNNVAIMLFFGYTLASILWSDFPMTAFKRWHKVLGHVIMALVVFTDRHPERAFRCLFRRCAYVLLPLSVLFIKYYPDLGRGFDFWTGAAVNPGVTTNKNALGNLCLVMGPFFLSSFLGEWRVTSWRSRLDRYVDLLFFVMIWWLLVMADSSAALVSTLLGVGVIGVLQIGAVKRHFTALLAIALVVAALLFAFTDIKDTVILALGEDTTLTGRTDLWEDLEAVPINPIVGVGFESFWLGDRLIPLWRKYWWQPNQAHNGYFETYLNLGLVGLLVQFLMIAACYYHARKQMRSPPSSDIDDETRALVIAHAHFKLAFLLGLLAFNLTDATFKALHLSFFVFFVVAVEYKTRGKAALPTIPRVALASRATEYRYQPRRIAAGARR